MTHVRFVFDTDTVTYQLCGRLAAINRQQNDTARQLAYQRFQETHGYFCRVPVLAFDTGAAEIYQSLVRQGLRIGAPDLQIAAITLGQNAILVTSNRRHFDLVPGLSVEDWNTLLPRPYLPPMCSAKKSRVRSRYSRSCAPVSVCGPRG